jgi:hypothetical protein
MRIFLASLPFRISIQTGFLLPRRCAMTRAQRAVACAIGIFPVTIAGIALVRCGCGTAAWTVELLTAAAYLVWILFTRR